MAEINIPVTVVDGASKALRGIGKGAAQSLKGVRVAADQAKKSFELMGGVATALNQGLELGKKAWESFRLVVVDTIASALEFRDKNDPVIKQFEQMRKSAELLRARLGDALIPVVQAVAAAFGPVSDGMSKWVQENRKLIASNILNFLGSMATILTKGVAGGIVLVSKAWTGWQLLIKGTTALLSGFFSVVLDGAADALGAMKTLADATGADGLAAELGAAEESVRGFGDVFSATSDEAVDEMFKIQQAQDELEKNTERVSKEVQRAITQGVVNGQRIIKESISGTNNSITEQGELAAKEADRQSLLAKLDEKRMSALASIREENANREAELIERNEAIKIAALEAEKARQEELATVAATGVEAIGAVLAESLANQEATAEDVFKSILKTVLTSVTQIIRALAAQAAAGVLAASSALGPVGLAIGTAAAGAAFSLVEGLIQRFQTGGFVRGGIPGRDSVPILAEPGEFVMSRDMVSGFRQFASQVLGASSGQQLTRAAISGEQAKTKAGDVVQSTTIINRTWVPSRQEEMKMSRRQAVSRTRLRNLGMIGPG